MHKNGIEKHIYELNKRLLAEEKWLIDQILIIYLYKQSGYSINIKMCIRDSNMNEVNVLECTDRLADERSEGALPKGGKRLWTYLA